jgi:hypothetical protein
LTVVELYDNGWVLAQDDDGAEGYVPESYLIDPKKAELPTYRAPAAPAPPLRTRRPTYIQAGGLDGKLKLEVSLNVFSIVAVDTVAQTFEASFCLRATTLNAPDLKTLPEGVALTTDNFDPRIRINNLFDTKDWRMKPMLKDDGQISYKYEIKGTFSEMVRKAFFEQCLVCVKERK